MTALSFTRAQKMVNHTVVHCRIDVCTWPTLWGAKQFTSISYFLHAWCVHIAHTFFTTQKQYWWDAKTETIHSVLKIWIRFIVLFVRNWPWICIFKKSVYEQLMLSWFPTVDLRTTDFRVGFFVTLQNSCQKRFRVGFWKNETITA